MYSVVWEDKDMCLSGCRLSFDNEVVQISILTWSRTCNTTHFGYPLKVKKHVEVG